MNVTGRNTEDITAAMMQRETKNGRLHRHAADPNLRPRRV